MGIPCEFLAAPCGLAAPESSGRRGGGVRPPPKLAVVLVVLLSAAYLLPAYFAGWAKWSQPAVEYVAYGVESAALWALLAAWPGQHVATRWVCAWGAFEAVQRPACRLAFDMTHRVALPEGVTLCEAAFGFPIGWVGLAIAGLVVTRMRHSDGGQ